MGKEPEALRKAISQLTGAEYEFQAPSKDFPPGGHAISWVLVSRAPLRGVSTIVAPTIWEDETETLFIESVELGSTSDWIYEMYGEKGAEKSTLMETEFFKGDVKHALKTHFPRVHERLRQYEDILANASSKHGVRLQAEYSVNKFVVTFYAVARFASKDLDDQARIGKIKLTIDAIKEALVEINKYEERRAESAR